MKKLGFVLLALVLVFGLAAIGCPSGGGGGGNEETEEGTPTVMFKLTEELAKMVEAGTAVDTNLDTTGTSTVFDDFKITNAGAVKMKIVKPADTYAVEIDTDTFNWGAGLDLIHKEIGFKTGDQIVVEGEILNDFPPAPSTGDTWATPMIYLACNPGADTKTDEKKDPPKGPFKFDYTLTAADINALVKASPANIRIGARPAGAQFRIDEITLTRIISGTPAATYTVTFVGEDKATELGKVTGVEKDLTIDPKNEDWYKAFIAGIPAGKELKGWYNLSGDEEWKFATSTVTGDVTLYPVVITSATLPAGYFKLQEIDSNWWFTNGRDGKTSTLTWDTLKAAKYLVLDVTSVVGEDGFGGIQIAFQSNTDSDQWRQVDVAGGWNQPTAAGGAWDIDSGSLDPFFIVIDITSIPSWSSIITGDSTTLAKIGINGGLSFHITLNYAYLVSTTLTKPANAFSLTQGWAVKEIAGLSH